jgi:hypothetical protein
MNSWKARKAANAAASRWGRGTLAGVLLAALAAGCGTEPERLVAVSIAGGEQAFVYGNTVYLSAKAHQSDGAWEDVTHLADWSSSATSVATVEPSPGGYQAVVTAVAPGEVAITATYQGLTATKTLTVPAP